MSAPLPPRVIGLDLSLTATGVASSLGWCESLGEDGITKLPLDERLDAIDTLARRILILIGGGRGNWPALVAIEIPAYSRSGAGSHERSALWWSVVRSLRRREVPVALVSIQQRMRYATGKGSASKGAVIDAVARRLPMFATGGDDNCADAAILAAMGADHLGHPLADMPKTHRAALDAVQWPEVARSLLGTHPDPDDPGYCGHELHGADGGRCPGCGWDSHPIPDGPAPPVDLGLPAVAPYLPAAATPEGIEDIALPGLEAAR